MTSIESNTQVPAVVPANDSSTSDVNTNIHEHDPSKKLLQCDAEFRTIVEHSGKIHHKLARQLVSQLWDDFRTWINRFLQVTLDKPKPLIGMVAFDAKIIKGSAREKTIFMKDLENLRLSLQEVKSMLLEGAENYLRGDEATQRDPVMESSNTKVLYNLDYGPRSDLGYYITLGIPMRLVLLQVASVRFSKTDKLDNLYLEELVFIKEGVTSQFMNGRFH
ncbi:hypothetical protein BDP55DRAFT_625717 [Colletotrichum godetiae]|uniref:Uncharacterized protein n=1 Tax=Colletotrichum godetiae TaxID=1209918 RepID=A0AAJ0F0R8_9PEZI|nr:uncharacterized protein BDP55DRAFT_625717 [Colletotrichum godetiae]KAK1701505.1 hypothetical protein BDP55DRAFT_625717 [Colletotrichum godetiae]